MSGFSSGLPVPLRVSGENIADAQGRLGSSFANIRGNGAVQTVLAAGANVNGLILRTVCYQIQAGYAQSGFYAGPSAPGGVRDLATRSIFIADNALQAPPSSINLAPNLFIPAGWGMFFASTSSEGVLSATWDLR